MAQFLAAILLAGCLLAGIPARAEASLPPEATLSVDGKTQDGRLKSYCWNDIPIHQICYSQDFYTFPRRALKADNQAVVILEKPEPPDSVVLRYWSRISRDETDSAWFDRPVGKPRRIEAEIQPLITPEGLRWQAVFQKPKENTVFYIEARAEWTVDAVCPGCDQWASWAFSLR